jgi:hypothetical protein
MCVTNDEALSLAGEDGSLRLSPAAAHALREAISHADRLVQEPEGTRGLCHLASLLVQLRTLRQSIA